jgi:hypothetical protein
MGNTTIMVTLSPDELAELIRNEVQNAIAPFLRKETFDLEEAAAYVGMAKNSFYKITSPKNCLIAHTVHGTKKTFRRDDLDAYLAKHRRKTNDEIDAIAAKRMMERGHAH